MNTNEYFIMYLTKSSDVVEYRIYFQLFTLGSTIIMAFNDGWRKGIGIGAVSVVLKSHLHQNLLEAIKKALNYTIVSENLEEYLKKEKFHCYICLLKNIVRVK